MATSKRTKRVVGTVAGLCVLMLASSAWAQDAAVAKENPAGDKGGDGYGYEFSDDPLAAGGFGPNDATIRVRPGPVRQGDVERAVLGHGPRLGAYQEGYGTALVRDERFPIRITIQFYKSTSDGIASEADLDGIAKSITNAYEHADYVGSLVIPPGDAHRPTAWQTMPREWFPW